MSDEVKVKRDTKKDGSYSRGKGKRNEYLLRDEIRRDGYTAHRVPSSGASQGAKGDVTFEKGDTKGLLELKARKDEYRMIYALYDTFKDSSGRMSVLVTDRDLVSVSVTPNLDAALDVPCVYEPASAFESKKGWIKQFRKTMSKLANLKKLLGEAHVLVIKTDRRPFLYITYR